MLEFLQNPTLDSMDIALLFKALVAFRVWLVRFLTLVAVYTLLPSVVTSIKPCTSCPHRTVKTFTAVMGTPDYG